LLIDKIFPNTFAELQMRWHDNNPAKPTVFFTP
jgi:hypothetical protein